MPQIIESLLSEDHIHYTFDPTQPRAIYVCLSCLPSLKQKVLFRETETNENFAAAYIRGW